MLVIILSTNTFFPISFLVTKFEFTHNVTTYWFSICLYDYISKSLILFISASINDFVSSISKHKIIKNNVDLICSIRRLTLSSCFAPWAHRSYMLESDHQLVVVSVKIKFKICVHKKRLKSLTVNNPEQALN